jgi:hypothetical protein
MTYPTIDTLPAAPNRNDPANFSTRADGLVGALPALVTQTNAAGVYTEAQAAAALQSVTDATAQVALATTQAELSTAKAVLAAASATAAAVTANATVWVSGSDYAQFANVISPIDIGTYRAINAITNSTVDPSADATNWTIISARPFEDQSGAEAGTATDKPMNALRTAQAIALLKLTSPVTALTPAATVDIDLSSDDYFTLAANQNTTFTFSNAPVSGRAFAFTLIFTQPSTAYVITWPSTVDWAGATAPAAPAGLAVNAYH